MVIVAPTNARANEETEPVDSNSRGGILPLSQSKLRK
jgi:hypothetical protein